MTHSSHRSYIYLKYEYIYIERERKRKRTTYIYIYMYRRLGVKPGNLNGSCVRDPDAGDYFVISAPGARACPWGLCLTLDFVLQFWDLFASVVPLKMLHVFVMCSWVIWSVLVRPGCDLMWLLASCLFALVQLFTVAVGPGTFVFPMFCWGLREARVCLSVKWCEVVWSSVKSVWSSVK